MGLCDIGRSLFHSSRSILSLADTLSQECIKLAQPLQAVPSTVDSAKQKIDSLTRSVVSDLDNEKKLRNKSISTQLVLWMQSLAAQKQYSTRLSSYRQQRPRLASRRRSVQWRIGHPVSMTVFHFQVVSWLTTALPGNSLNAKWLVVFECQLISRLCMPGD